MQSTTPQQSTRGFVAPSTAPVKKTPDITDIIGEKNNTLNPYSQKAPLVGAEEQKSRKAEEENTLQPHFQEETSVDDINNNLRKSVSSASSACQNFPETWQKMFELVFASVPTIYFPLKNSIPEIDNNIINLTVKNEIQKEHFEAKKREVLEYLRTHFSEQIEDIIVRANEQMETKKIIYDVKDKLQNFKEQNVEFDDFVQILNLTIKE